MLCGLPRRPPLPGPVFCHMGIVWRVSEIPFTRVSGSQTGTQLSGLPFIFLTDEIIGFSNVIIPDSDLQGLFGQVSMLDFVAELLLARRGC